MRGLTGWLRRGAVPVVLTAACVLGLVGAALADVETGTSEVVLQQSGHWAVDPAARSVLHVQGGTRQVDARVALPDDAVADARMALQGGTEGFVVGRDRAWSFDTAALTAGSPVPLPATDERPVGVEVPGGPYLVYRGRGTLVRLGRPTAVVEAGGPVGPPVATDDGTVWVHRPDTGALCAFRRGAVTLDCGVRAGGPGGLTVVGDVATFVDTRAATAAPIRDGALGTGAALGTALPDDVLLGDRSTRTRLPVVEPAVPRLRLLDLTAGAPVDVPLAAGTYSAPLASGESVVVLELGSSTLLTFSADGTKVAELRLPPGTDATDLHRGEDGRVYVDERGGARTHVVAPDGTIVTIDLTAGSSGAGVAGAAAVRDTVAPPPPGAVTVPVPVQGPDVAAAPLPGGAPVPGSGGASGGSGGGGGGGGGANRPQQPPTPGPLLPPAAPVSVKAVLSGADRATVTWGPGAGGGAPASYTVTRSDGVTATATGRTFVSPDLAVGTSYRFTVTASNTAGTSAESAASNAVTPQAAKAAAPPGFTAERWKSGSQSGLRTKWQQPDLRGGTLVHYVVDGTYAGGKLTPKTTTETNAGFFVDDGEPTNCVAITFRVRAVTTPPGGGPPTDGEVATDSIPYEPLCSAQTGTLTLGPTTGTVATGETLQLTVRLDPNDAPIESVSFNLSAPSAQLECTSISAGAGWTATDPECSGSSVRFSADASAPKSKPSTVATVTFTAVGPGTAKVRMSSGSATSTNGPGFTVYSNNGTYTVT